MKINGIFKRQGWKPYSKSEYERFLEIEKKLRENLQNYRLSESSYPIIQKFA